MITMHHLSMRNFLSHRDTEIDFHEYSGLVLIEGKNTSGYYGSNGSGKSTILEGIVYALTGNTLRNVGVNDVINRNSKKNTRVSLRFDKDGEEYEIIRYRKDDQYGDDIVFKKGDQNISKRLNKDTQTLIENVLEISFRVFSSTVLLGEGLSSKFTQLSDPDKKSLIESTLNLNYDVNDLRSKVKTKLSALSVDQANLSGQLTSLEEYQGYDIETAKSQIIELKTLRDKLQHDYDRVNTDINPKTEHMQTLNNKIALIDQTLRDIESTKSTLDRLAHEKEKLESDLDHVDGCDNPICSLCHQELKTEESKEAVRTSIQDQISQVTSSIEENTNILNNYPDVSVLSDTRTRLSDEKIKLQQEITEISSTLSTLNTELMSKNSEISTIEYAMKKYDESQSQIDDLKSKLKITDHDQAIYEYFNQLFSPTGIIVDILSEAISYINDRLSAYSSVLLDKRYKIEFKKGKISLQDDTGSSYQSLSNGEKRRLDISIQFSLHDYVTMYCGLKMNCCFIDEILDTLDDIGVDNIFDVLRLKLEYCDLSGIYVITHNDNLKNKFDSIITVIKDVNGDSQIQKMA